MNTFSPQEVAAKAGLSLSTIYHDIRSGHVTAFRERGRYTISLGHVHLWLYFRRYAFDSWTVEERQWLDELETKMLSEK